LSDLLRLGLHDLHVELGGKMVPFAGYEMPVQYPAGVMKEHLHTRAAAGLFDVSHMGQVLLRPKQGMAALAAAFEALMPVDVASLAEGRQRYGLFTNDAGGVLDDLMFANRGDHLFVVVNAARKGHDIPHMAAHLTAVAEVVPVTDRALLALQGPQAEAALARLEPRVAAMKFMDVGVFGDLWVSRSGYTGEDGYEISVPQARAEAFARALLAMPEVLPIGLGARDSLRLEAGLCLYGHDLDETTSPVEAGLTWAIQKSRRAGGDREGGFRAPRASCANWPTARRASASACAPRAARRCARAWRCFPAIRPRAPSARAASARRSKAPSPWPMCPPLSPPAAPGWTARSGASGCP
jgi:aminomethyltransferase